MKADRTRSSGKGASKSAARHATPAAHSRGGATGSGLASVPANASLTTGEMARLSNNTLRTVRFYEEAGILSPVARTDGGHRLFGRSELERLMLVSDMREAGFSLEDIRALLLTKEQAKSGGDASSQASTLLREHLTGIRHKVAVLVRLAEDLEGTLIAAQACQGCAKPDLFPDNCVDCDELGKNPPRGMRVLWSLGRATGSGAAKNAGQAK